ncbi:MAG: hypothetical protein KG003_08710 [Bacteroidetes bacterium]|nr:hypothetical protein [Bacteroidota bacterium]
MKNTLSFILGCIFTSSLFSQSPTFSIGSDTYSSLVGATPVMKDSVWDDPDVWKTSERNIPLGFTFHAFGKNITTFSWEQAGVSFRDVDTVVYIGFKDFDMCDLGYGTQNAMSPISRKLEGTAGFHIMKLEWRRFGIWDDWSQNGKFSDSGYVQLWIYESSRKIELHFGKSNFSDLTTIYPDGVSLIAAKYDDDGRTSGIKLDGQAANPTVYSFDDTSDRSIKSWPVQNTVYIFSFGSAGMNDISKSLQNAYYFDHKLMLKSVQKEMLNLNIYNPSGQCIQHVEVRDGVAEVSDLKPGMYIAKPDSGAVGFLRFVVLE